MLSTVDRLVENVVTATNRVLPEKRVGINEFEGEVFVLKKEVYDKFEIGGVVFTFDGTLLEPEFASVVKAFETLRLAEIDLDIFLKSAVEKSK